MTEIHALYLSIGYPFSVRYILMIAFITLDTVICNSDSEVLRNDPFVMNY